MSEKNVKFLRGQVRRIVKELLPDLFNTETAKGMERNVMTRVDSRLSEITKAVRETLDTVDKRSLDLQAYVVRNTGIVEAPKQDPATPTALTATKSDDAGL